MSTVLLPDLEFVLSGSTMPLRFFNALLGLSSGLRSWSFCKFCSAPFFKLRFSKPVNAPELLFSQKAERQMLPQNLASLLLFLSIAPPQFKHFLCNMATLFNLSFQYLKKQRA